MLVSIVIPCYNSEQTIGKVGSVSCECAEESHIHLEVIEGEKYLDPIKAMK